MATQQEIIKRFMKALDTHKLNWSDKGQLTNHENTWMHVLNAHFQVKEARLKRLRAA